MGDGMDGGGSNGRFWGAPILAQNPGKCSVSPRKEAKSGRPTNGPFLPPPIKSPSCRPLAHQIPQLSPSRGSNGTRYTPECTKIANRNRSDSPSQRPNRREIPQKEHDFCSEFAESNRNRQRFQVRALNLNRNVSLIKGCRISQQCPACSGNSQSQKLCDLGALSPTRRCHSYTVACCATLCHSDLWMSTAMQSMTLGKTALPIPCNNNDNNNNNNNNNNNTTTSDVSELRFAVASISMDWETDFFTTTGAGASGQGAGPVRISTGNHFPRKYQRIQQNYYQSVSAILGQRYTEL